MESKVAYNEDYYMDMCGYELRPKYADLDGNEVKRNPITNPYNFDEYVEWQSGYQKDNSAVYSDRLWQWDSQKYDKCCQEVFKNTGQMFSGRNPEGIQRFLSIYFDKEIRLTAILRGCNQWSGFPYWVFCYEESL